LQPEEALKTIAFMHLWGQFDFYTFQQDSAPALRAREMVEFLARMTPDFTPPELLSADTMNSLSSVNQTKFVIEGGIITALLSAPVEMSRHVVVNISRRQVMSRLEKNI